MTGVTQTFATQLVGMGVTLQTFQANLGKLLTSAGYDVVYKGKWHESLAVRGADNWTAEDITYPDYMADDDLCSTVVDTEVVLWFGADADPGTAYCAAGL